MKKTIIATLLLALLSFGFFANGQDYPFTDSLKTNLAKAKTPAEKVKWLGELSSFYRTVNETLADQYSKEQMLIAELSRDRKVMLTALLSQASSNYNYSGVQRYMLKGKEFSQKAFELAKESQLPEYQAWAYTYMARGARNDGELDKALMYNNLALSIATGTSNDSLKIFAHNSLANTYLARKEKLLAFRNYLTAMNLAEETGKFDAMKACYDNLSSFYIGMENYEKAKDYAFKNFTLTKNFARPYERLEVYNDIGSIYARAKNYDMAADFYDKAIKLADTLKFEIVKINTYGRIIDMYFMNNQAQKALEYINSKKDLQRFMLNAGLGFYIDHAYALAYLETKRFDSAYHRFKKAEPEFLNKVIRYNQYFFLEQFANFYEKTGNNQKALEYLKKCEEIGIERQDISLREEIAGRLDSVYQRLGDFKNAYIQKVKYHTYKDSLKTMEAEKDLLALEVENENQKKIREAQLADQEKRDRHNVQYMGITAGIASIFIVLVMMGAFSVSKTTIRIIGFFAFICLFEFIILLADHKIHDATHGEPWKILAIKILLISILLPLHHWLEHKVIHFLTERRLIEMNKKTWIGRLTGKPEGVAS